MEMLFISGQLLCHGGRVVQSEHERIMRMTPLSILFPQTPQLPCVSESSSLMVGSPHTGLLLFEVINVSTIATLNATTKQQTRGFLSLKAGQLRCLVRQV
jgi:hypothetical protein